MVHDYGKYNKRILKKINNIIFKKFEDKSIYRESNSK